MRALLTCLAGLAMVSGARAEPLGEAVPATEFEDGLRLHGAGDAVGTLASGRERLGATGRLALSLMLQRAWDEDPGLDGLPLRGPRWTDHWGLRLDLRGSLGTGETPFEVEERLEAGLYFFSVGQTLEWAQTPRLVDRVEATDNETASVGVFGEFQGVGFGAGDMSVECLPFSVAYRRHYDLREPGFADLGESITVESATLRGTGWLEGGPVTDIRLASGRVTAHRFRRNGDLQAKTYEVDIMALRGMPLSWEGAPPWAFDVAYGFAGVVADNARSGIFKFELGAHHIGDLEREPDTRRSELGSRRYGMDFGVTLQSMQRLREDAVDKGVELRAYVRRPLSHVVSAFAEGYGFVGDRALVTDEDGQWQEHDQLVWTVRADAGLELRLGRHFDAVVELWAERSDRRTEAFEWSAGAQLGLGARL